MNLSEEDLRARVIDAWDRGEPMTWSGETASSVDAFRIKIYESIRPIGADIEKPMDIVSAGGRDVTNYWIKGPAGRLAGAASADAADAGVPVARERNRVMVVHGRNLKARDAMFNFLRALGLDPIEWEEAIGETGVGSPHNLDAVRAAMEVAQAVVVLLTAEDRAGVLPEFAGDDEEDTQLRGQPRQNVILEAGLAMGVDRSRVILVELGEIRRASDFEGLNVVRLTNAAASRVALRNRLQRAGCEVEEGRTDWTRPEAGTDFDATVVRWEPVSVP